MSSQATSNVEQDKKRSPVRFRRLRASLLVLGVCLWIFLLYSWAAGVKPREWKDWLKNLNRPEKVARDRDGKFGRRATGAGRLAYLGEGRAELGKYCVSMFDPLTKTAIQADFKLRGITVYEDETEFREFLKHNHRFLREQVMVTIRNCDPGDLDDPDLRILEKKVVARVNRALGKRFLRTVNFSDFYIRQTPMETGPESAEPPQDDVAIQ